LEIFDRARNEKITTHHAALEAAEQRLKMIAAMKARI
jgi:hypothetical protein